MELAQFGVEQFSAAMLVQNLGKENIESGNFVQFTIWTYAVLQLHPSLVSGVHL